MTNPILAKILAEKAAKAAASSTTAATTTTQDIAARVAPALAAQPVTPVASGLTLQQRLANQRAALAAKNPSTMLAGGAAVVGTAPDQKMGVAELQQAKGVSNVLTAQQQATNQAKSLIEKRAEEGFYQIKEAASLPIELPASVVEQKLLELDAALLARTPDLPMLVVKINQNLRQYEELAYLLNDEQLHLVVESNLAAAGVMINTGKATDKTQSAKLAQKLASVTLDDFM